MARKNTSGPSRPAPGKRLVRSLVAIPLAALLAGAGLMGFSLGLDSLHHQAARKNLLQLQSEPARPERELRVQLTRARDHLARTGPMGRHSPVHYDLVGQLLFWEAVNLEPMGRIRSEKLQQAEATYREAIRRRPTWPYYWSNLVLAKAERGVFDLEFRQALKRAVETGPWERRIQWALIRMDFVEGSRIDRRSRALIDDVIRRALRVRPSEIFQLAESFGKLRRVCGLMQDPDPRFQQRCAPVASP